jgi:hypothetical protein
MLMSAKNSKSNGYSADVRMYLKVGDHTLRIGQLGPDFLILRGAPELPPSDGEVTLSIDGRVRQWSVRLPDGISTSSARTRITGSV